MSETSNTSEQVSPPGILKKPRPIVSRMDDEDMMLERPLHMRPFKLRFAPRRDLGRSYVSLVKPLGLEAIVTPKFHTRHRERGEERVSEEHVQQVFKRIEEKFALGPKEKYQAPVASSQEYGWWCNAATPIPRDRRLQHHIRDSYWMKSRIAVLAEDQKLKNR